MDQTEELKQANILIAELQTEIGELEGVLINYRRQSVDVSTDRPVPDPAPLGIWDYALGRQEDSGLVVDDSRQPDITALPGTVSGPDSTYTSEGFLRRTPRAEPADHIAFRFYRAGGGDYEINRWLRERRYARRAVPPAVPFALEGDGTSPQAWDSREVDIVEADTLEAMRDAMRDGGEVDTAELEVSPPEMYNRAARESHRRFVVMTGSDMSLREYVVTQRVGTGNPIWGSAVR